MSLARIARFVLGVVIGLMGIGVFYGAAFVAFEVLPDEWPRLWYGVPTLFVLTLSIITGFVVIIGGLLWAAGIIELSE